MKIGTFNCISTPRRRPVAALWCIFLSSLLVLGCAGGPQSPTAGTPPDLPAEPHIPEESEDNQLGKAFLAEALKHYRFVKDPEVVSLVNEVGRRIVAATGSNPDGYHFFIVREAQLNAFAIPGGYIFLFEGLLAQVNGVDELAGVLAHEVAHVQKNHFFKDQGKIRAMELATIAAILLGGPEAAVLAAGANMNLQLQFSRENEEEADAAALIYLRRTRYRPEGLVGFFETLASYERFNPPILPSYFSTHPGVQERVRTVSDLLRANHGADPRPGPAQDADDWVRTAVVLRSLPAGGERTPEDMERMLKQTLGDREVPEHHRRYLMGLAYLKMDRIAQAIPLYEGALDLNPDIAEYHSDLSYCYLRSKKLDSARRSAERALALSPGLPMAHLVLGIADAEEGALDSAIEHYLKALEKRPDDHRIHWNLSQAYLKKNEAMRGAYHVGRSLRLNLEPRKALDQFRHALKLAEKESEMAVKIRSEIEGIKAEGV